MSIDGRIPLRGEVLQYADMIEMAVGQHDRAWACALAEAVRSSRLDQGFRAEQTGIDEHPAAITGIRFADQNDVDDGEPAIAKVRRDLTDGIVLGFCIGAGT